LPLVPAGTGFSLMFSLIIAFSLVLRALCVQLAAARLTLDTSVTEELDPAAIAVAVDDGVLGLEAAPLEVARLVGGLVRTHVEVQHAFIDSPS
jgi:hypothetical protein